jgi:hypothetical protein
VIHDNQPAAVSDLGSQFFLRDTDVRSSTSRAEASLSRLAELNPYVTVSLSTLDLTVNSDLSPLSQYQVNIHDHLFVHIWPGESELTYSSTPNGEIFLLMGAVVSVRPTKDYTLLLT